MAYTNNNSTAGAIGTDTNASLQNVKDDLRTLKTDVVDLGVQAKEEGKKRLNDAASTAQDKLSSLKSVGADEMSSIKTFISENPAQSVAYAFGAGFVLSLLFGRR